MYPFFENIIIINKIIFQIHLTTIKNDYNWIKQLIYLLDLQIKGLEKYEQV